ncbi:achaete-scute homolog 4-like [Gouania willdenowi]|uniref:achaete-scute homolog 4-like n=1 Tax=Gouania willdenowi TaxID=441366 RepID=UPI0010559D36|nr:achaete-scute homolog 4-like [Gouania willdenowi]XP_028306705.1 achaete-scute homolog 4-like [Gouania willdenowi]
MSYHSPEFIEHHIARYKVGLPFHLEVAYVDSVHGQRSPCRRLPYFPFHGALGVCEYTVEPAFIRKRNERERHRVRCVNEGYARLREHLPHEREDKRLSKVETLRAAIDYIKHLQDLLGFNLPGMETELSDDGETQLSLTGHNQGQIPKHRDI